jgi:hypothetical protein
MDSITTHSSESASVRKQRLDHWEIDSESSGNKYASESIKSSGIIGISIPSLSFAIKLLRQLISLIWITPQRPGVSPNPSFDLWYSEDLKKI